MKRFNPTLPMPAYKTAGAAGIDLAARETVVIAPQAFGYVPLNVAVALPEGYWGLLTARSSLHKRGLLLGNGVAVMDPDYRGPEDEYIAILYNTTSEPVTIETKERIVQLILLPLSRFPISEDPLLHQPNRGGIGSTGTL